ncbi:hypothetical protein RZE82_04810 [Mollicutes bacterium LVI A0039]|nr:hypothetical protein RZE82_04810 [Mollicutes bacterium LVI A0039]
MLLIYRLFFGKMTNDIIITSLLYYLVSIVVFNVYFILSNILEFNFNDYLLAMFAIVFIIKIVAFVKLYNIPSSTKSLLQIVNIVITSLIILVTFNFFTFNPIANSDQQLVIDEVFTDPVFRSEMERLDEDDDGVISVESLQTIEHLDFANSDISDLSGAQYFEKLDYINLSCTNISEINELNNIERIHNVYIFGNADNGISSKEMYDVQTNLKVPSANGKYAETKILTTNENLSVHDAC